MVKYKIVQKVYALQRRFILSERNHFFQRIKRIFTGLKRLLTYNIATIMFGALLLYMIITVVLYATSSHVTSYQVTVGPLTRIPFVQVWLFVRNRLFRQELPGMWSIMQEKVCRCARMVPYMH